MGTEFQKKEELSFKEIVMSTIQKIGEKASKEFRGGGQKTVIHGDWAEQVIEPDSRKEYIQLVEFMSDILLPEFDNGTKDKYEEIIVKVNNNLQEYNSNKIEKEDYVLKKLELMRELLRLMMFRLKSTGYLKRQEVIG